MNTEFDYIYRDGANYKKSGAVILRGEMTPELQMQLESALNEAACFIADQIGVPEVFLWESDYRPDTDDHCWHEYAGWSLTNREPTDDRTITEFIAIIAAESDRGWREFTIGEDGTRLYIGKWIIQYSGEELEFTDAKEVQAWAQDGIEQEEVGSIVGPDGKQYGLSWTVELEEI